MAGVIGVSDKLTGNIDFGWILVATGAIVSVYYLAALVYLVAHDAARYASVALLALFLWSAATVIAVLPATAKAMRGWSPAR